MQRESISQRFPIGSSLPAFKLKDTDGRIVSSESLHTAKAALVAFTCNHCPYVIGSEEMLVEIVKKYIPLGLIAVAINSNDAGEYPDDSFENMQKKAQHMKLPYRYLRDETQAVAHLFDAACTPEFYLFDSSQKLAYHGTINDSPRDPEAVSKDYLSEAIEQVLAGKPAVPNYVHPFGCSIKWK